MKRKDIVGVALAMFVLAIGGVIWLAPWQGQAAPEAHFTTLEGEQFKLSELRGQPVLVTFWATSCPSCITEIPHLKDLYRELAPKGLKIFGVAMSYDPPQQVAAMAAERDMFYPVVLDSDEAIARAFGDIRLTPTSVLIDPEGRIVWRRLGELNMPQVRQQIVDMLTAG